uniref:BURP domain protein RD22-like n=1 Tax=Erigeron canadensis TaxID=72917 RepID=UPI001CB8DE13|nr:BURP domain protein RD22-like [Erigeron canadensis]
MRWRRRMVVVHGGCGDIMVINVKMLALIVSHAAAAHVSSSPEAYWKSVLPNTPIPKSVSELLKIDTPPGTRAEEAHSVSIDAIIDGPPATHVDIITGVGEQGAKHNSPANYGTTGALLFLEKDMYHQSHLKKTLKFTKKLTIPSSTFLPREVANTIPFSSNNLPELYTRFSIKPRSKESESMKKSISLCEDEALKGEEKYCATSLEDMVDFTTSKLGKKVKAISTEVIHPNKLQKYTMDSSRKLATSEFVNCHRLSYPYPVFYCHKVISTRAYSISLSGEDGTKAKALAICHDNGAKLYSKDLVLKVLGVTPGSAQICHFLPEDHVVFVPY